MALIADKIKIIKEDIKNIEKIGGFKKIVSEHARINTELQSCVNSVNELNLLMESFNEKNNSNTTDNTLLDENDQDIKLELTDEQYNEHIDYLKGINDVYDQLDNVEEQIQIYVEAMNKIKLITKYLENRKMEVVKI